MSLKLGSRHILMAATGQHVGKTTTCLGLVDGLQKILAKEGKVLSYCKPVGQQHIEVENGVRVDKDTYVFKDYFNLPHDYKDMSPVIFPRKFTRDFLDGKITSKQLYEDVKTAYKNLSEQSDFVIAEGTGHTGVGTICDINNAQVAAACNMDIVIVALGGLGSSFDELALSYEMLKNHNVRLKGVILNKVRADKMEMVEHYFKKALARWDVPLLGCIPNLPELSHPSMADFKKLFKTSEVVAGANHPLRYFTSSRLALAPVDERNTLKPIQNQLIITHSNREDVLDAVIANQRDLQRREEDLRPGLLLTGWAAPSDDVINKLEAADIPTLYIPNVAADSYHVMTTIAGFTAKLNRADERRLKLAIDHVGAHVDYEGILA